ncbi:MAG TPA: hypothetical protein ENL20_07070 [Candidatus Cloacimonetes bacterium]|nr:hypothetical protein [Candidatus Cloacimonadota bacterium]
MHTQVFRTKVHEDGVIRIPEIKNLVNHYVDVYLRDRTDVKKNEKMTFRKFIKKWEGIIEGADPDKMKFEFLKEKYKL